MEITDEQREAVARLEAKIRGLGWAGRIDTLPSANEVYASILVVGKSKDDASVGRTYLAATPPDTAEGREWWCEALNLSVIPTLHLDGWMAYSDDAETNKRTARAEAITAAVIAAATAEGE